MTHFEWCKHSPCSVESPSVCAVCRLSWSTAQENIAEATDFDIRVICDHMSTVKSGSVRQSWQNIRNRLYRLDELSRTENK